MDLRAEVEASLTQEWTEASLQSLLLLFFATNYPPTGFVKLKIPTVRDTSITTTSYELITVMNHNNLSVSFKQSNKVGEL